MGVCSAESERVLLNRQSSPDIPDDIEPTVLLTNKADVQRTNEERLARLPTAPRALVAEDRGSGSLLAALQNTCPAPSKLTLKVGAQVILLRNLQVAKGLCNGSRGVVLRFAGANGYPVVRFALPESPAPRGVSNPNIPKNPAANPLSCANTHTRPAKTKTYVDLMIGPEEFPLKVSGETVASRRQVPLELAWAISIHKSQGMSLDFAKVNLSNVFEYGQAYVALSRVKSLAGLHLQGFRRGLVKAHPKVVEFYNSLHSVNVNETTATNNTNCSAGGPDEADTDAQHEQIYSNLEVASRRKNAPLNSYSYISSSP